MESASANTNWGGMTRALATCHVPDRVTNVKASAPPVALPPFNSMMERAGTEVRVETARVIAAFKEEVVSERRVPLFPDPQNTLHKKYPEELAVMFKHPVGATARAKMSRKRVRGCSITYGKRKCA